MNYILLSILGSRQSLRSEGDVQVDGTQMKQQMWRNFWERKVWWKIHLKVELHSDLLVGSWEDTLLRLSIT